MVVELGELVGCDVSLRQRDNRGNLVPTFTGLQNPPRLVSNIEGMQLYVVGGSGISRSLHGQSKVRATAIYIRHFACG